MNCYLCENEAVSRCYQCGELICTQHGNENCIRCNTSIEAGDPRSDRVSTVRLSKQEKPGWWRPQPAEDYDPPGCAECQALTRALCRNCGDRYCADHAGPDGLCSACGRSYRLGLFWFVASLGILLGIALIGYFSTHSFLGF